MASSVIVSGRIPRSMRSHTWLPVATWLVPTKAWAPMVPWTSSTYHLRPTVFGKVITSTHLIFTPPAADAPGCSQRRLLSAARRGATEAAVMLAELPPPPDCGLCQTTGTLPVAPAASTVAAAVAIVLWYVEGGAPLTLLLCPVPDARHAACGPGSEHGCGRSGDRALVRGRRRAAHAVAVLGRAWDEEAPPDAAPSAPRGRRPAHEALSLPGQGVAGGRAHHRARIGARERR